MPEARRKSGFFIGIKLARHRPRQRAQKLREPRMSNIYCWMARHIKWLCKPQGLQT